MSRSLLITYLGGGLDAHHLISPRRGTNRATYTSVRGALALADNPSQALSEDWMLHPAMSNLRALYAEGRVAVVMNTGTLAVPTTRAQYDARSVPLPRALQSHNDQTRTWQLGDATDLMGMSGWIGRMIAALPSSLRGGSFSQITSMAGPQPGFTAPGIRALGLGPTGVLVRQPSIPAKVIQMMEGVMGRAGSFGHPLADEFAAAQLRANQSSAVVRNALAMVTDTTPYPGLPELQTVARLFKSDAYSGRPRSVHFSTQGNYDTHADMMSTLDKNLKTLDQGIGSFWNSAKALGIENDVSMLIHSEFGRSLVPNGSGTDHGWGGHALLIGPVRGGLHGKAPDLRLNGPDMVESRGILLPSTPTEHLLAEIARWMGVPNASMSAVFPNLGAFPASTLKLYA